MADLVADGLIPIRIDHEAGLAILKAENKRKKAIEEAIKSQETFIWKTQSILIRQSLQTSGLLAGARSYQSEVSTSMQWQESEDCAQNLFT